jgi:predicted component of type VI protein secretion system
VASKVVAGREELHAELEAAIEASEPRLVEVPVAPGMALF